MLISWFDTSEAQKLGKTLAEKFAKECLVLDKKKANVEKRAKLINSLILDVRQFMQTHELNVYKKAKLVKTFNSCLLEKGYDAEFVKNRNFSACFLREIQNLSERFFRLIRKIRWEQNIF